MAALMLSLLATQSSISLMIVFPFRDKWFYDELFELISVFRFQKVRPVSSTELSNMYELGRPMVSQLFQYYQHKRILKSSFASSAGLLFALAGKQSSPG